ncbi:MAG: four helix bundle protein [Deltaproteobacteria bacterium]|nr:four helix bundle protein [Deltaproteobacteria bacterium]MBW2670177.1 four helix bundle protein [Deltaproteobacteria bacterium]
MEDSRIQGSKGSSEMLKNYISYGSVCELETQILLAGDLDLIEKSELGTLKKDIAEIERMLKALIKSLENKPLNP